MKCVFLIHLLDQDFILNTWKEWVQRLPRFYWKVVNGPLSRAMPIRLPVRSFRIDLPGVESVEGRILSVWRRPQEMLEDQRMALSRIRRGCEIAEEWGATVVGLGGLNGVVGMRGEALRDDVRVAVTNGNHLVIPTVVRHVIEILHLLDADLATEEIVIVGFPGIHAPHIARLLVERGARRLTLVARSMTRAIGRLASELEATEGTRVCLVKDPVDGLRKGRTIIGATASGGVIRQSDLLPGTLMFNANVLRDICGNRPERDDVLILDGGVVTMPEGTKVSGDLFGLGKRVIYTCLAEVVLSGLERPGESYSVGRSIVPEKIKAIEGLAHAYAMKPASLLSFTRPVSEEVIDKVRAIRKMKGERARSGVSHE